MTRYASLTVLVIIAATFAAITLGRAETLSISATGLVLRCPCTPDAEDTAEEDRGLLIAQKANGRYFVPVIFPKTVGQKVCSFTMLYQDTNAADTITARLYGKSAVVGGNAVGGRHTLATLTSAGGVVNTVRQATTTAIAAAVIRATWFYYIEVDLKTVNLNVIGFRVEYKPTC